MLDALERELTAIGASVGAGCEPCLTYHVQTATSAGATAAALLKAVEDAECVRRGATGRLAMLGRQLLTLHAEAPADCCDTSDRAKELAAIGAAVGANSIAILREHLDAGMLVGISAREANEAVRIARAVQRRAAEITSDEAMRLVPQASVAQAAPVRQRPALPVAASLAARPGSVVSAAAPTAEAACGPDCGCQSTVSAAAPTARAACGPDCGCQSVASTDAQAFTTASAGEGACGCN
jgi:AhpD family alkylhydroperoxidase